MNRQEKSQQVDELRDLFDGAQLAILTHYAGLDVPSMVELRSELRKNQAGYRVVKNTLARWATADTELEVLHEHFEGPVGVVVAKEDAAAAAKVVTEFAKAHPALEIKAGVLTGGKVLDAEGIQQLARLPGKDELRAQLLSTLNGVASNLVRVLSAPGRDLVGVLEARRRELAGEG
ncbi:MAG: 50S ribosomal protein L10 [Myxococcota bacterium]